MLVSSRVFAHTRDKEDEESAEIEESPFDGDLSEWWDNCSRRLTLHMKDEMIDIISFTEDKGYEGVVTHWGVTRLPRKTHTGLRILLVLVSGITVEFHLRWPVFGQNEYHHRIEMNKKVYKLGKGWTRVFMQPNQVCRRECHYSYGWISLLWCGEG
ncbi:60S ribosomal protein L3 [Datura stramonium]|uniref:60S ribosomal protein L3 n=1 Tax=Datura stramonium TaxID=4076 RepID=A0ABS8WNN6_DATST|nr:60S ribosomal protein L3 [Datura stramonium]